MQYCRVSLEMKDGCNATYKNRRDLSTSDSCSHDHNTHTECVLWLCTDPTHSEGSSPHNNHRETDNVAKVHLCVIFAKLKKGKRKTPFTVKYPRDRFLLSAKVRRVAGLMDDKIETSHPEIRHILRHEPRKTRQIRIGPLPPLVSRLARRDAKI